MHHRPLFHFPRPHRKPVPKRTWPSRLKAGFRRFLTIVGGIVVFFIVAAILIGMGSDGKTALPNKFALYLPLDSDFLEHENMAGPYIFGGGGMVLRDVIETINAAVSDKRVQGLVLNLKGGTLNIAHLQELTDAVKAFRASGKFAYIYAVSYGEAGPGLGSYYLASAFDEIWMQPVGTVSLTGISAEMPFARGALEKIGVEPQFFARKEYKSVFETFTRSEMSPENRTMMTALIDDLAGQMVEGIAANRKQDVASVRSLIDRGVFLDQEAEAAKLVTHLDDFSALRRKLSLEMTGKPDYEDALIHLADYYDATGKTKPAAKDKAVALIYVVGNIISGGGESASMTGEVMAAADDIEHDIIDAVADDSIQALVVRIDSPGGSPVASETIRRALVRARDAGKPVIVSMGSMAASGGYWVASPADRIFAMPGTLTGSIGVAGGKFVLQDLWKKIGIHWDGVEFGAEAGMWSPNEKFTESQSAIMNRMMDSVYDAFITRVAEGRKMSPADADKIARGRVWSGRQAKAIGLVDELGTLGSALDYAAREIGAKDRHAVDVVIMPRPRSTFELVMDLLEGQVRMGDVLRSATALAPYLKTLSAMTPERNEMTYLPLEIR